MLNSIAILLLTKRVWRSTRFEQAVADWAWRHLASVGKEG